MMIDTIDTWHTPHAYGVFRWSATLVGTGIVEYGVDEQDAIHRLKVVLNARYDTRMFRFHKVIVYGR